MAPVKALRNKRSFTDLKARNDRIIADRAAGMNYAAMSEKHGISPEHCRCICKAAGLPNKLETRDKAALRMYPHMMHRHATREQRRQAELDKRQRLQAEIDAMQSPVRVRTPKQLQKLRDDIKSRIRVVIPSTGYGP